MMVKKLNTSLLSWFPTRDLEIKHQPTDCLSHSTGTQGAGGNRMLKLIVIRNETVTIKTVRKKPSRHWCDWGDLVEGSFVKEHVLQWRVSKLLNESPYGRQNQTNRRTCLEKLVLWNHNIIFDLPLWWFIALRLHFYYVFQTFEARTRTNQADHYWIWNNWPLTRVSN